MPFYKILFAWILACCLIACRSSQKIARQHLNLSDNWSMVIADYPSPSAANLADFKMPPNIFVASKSDKSDSVLAKSPAHVRVITFNRDATTIQADSFFKSSAIDNRYDGLPNTHNSFMSPILILLVSVILLGLVLRLLKG